MSFWVYILANRPGGTLFVGVTSNLIQRVSNIETASQWIYETLRRDKAGVFRRTRHGLSGDPTGKEHQTLAPGMEDRPDRIDES